MKVIALVLVCWLAVNVAMLQMTPDADSVSAFFTFNVFMAFAFLGLLVERRTEI